jgi:sec-independent protein translocase protein TatC
MREDHEMTLGEHLEELRRCVMRAIYGVVICACVAGFFYKPIMTALLLPYHEAWREAVKDYNASVATTATSGHAAITKTDGTVIPPVTSSDGTTAVTSTVSTTGTDTLPGSAFPPPRIFMGTPATGILAIIMVTTIVGLLAASPWVIYQIWMFVGVGLREKEQRFIRIYGPVSFLLFVAGAVMFYVVVLPYGLRALMAPTLWITVKDMQLFSADVALDDYLKFIGMMTIVFGLIFETPLVILFLARTRIVPLKTLARRQKLIIFIMIVVGAFIAPTGDPITCTLMAVPLIVLYELGLLVAWLLERRDRRKHPERYEDYGE